MKQMCLTRNNEQPEIYTAVYMLPFGKNLKSNYGNEN